jgi:predicted RNA-binding Zn-ribbon protein involved in translation (DUF1610 family)
MNFIIIINKLARITLSILAIVLKSSRLKGMAGECVVNLNARLFLDKEKYHPIKHVTLPTEGGSTQIDHIIVSIYGIFVIETKNMRGGIFGSATEKSWTQSIGQHSRKFQNPLHQNYKHVKTLESLLGLNSQQLFSVVVFIGNGRFKTNMPKNVMYGHTYIRFIKSKTHVILTTTDVKRITAKIQACRLSSSAKTNREHVQHVRNLVTEKEKGKTRQCPTCGSAMVLREAKQKQRMGGVFWGCVNFPICRGAISIN